MELVKSAGVIAAGEGSRFKQTGIQTHKPLIPVAGLPLIGHTLNYFQALGIQRVVIIFNSQEQECVDWVQQRFSRLQCEFIVKSTDSSFESFWLVGQKLGPGRHLISTVDSFCSPKQLKKIAAADPSSNVYLGVTSFVDDEKPVWVTMNDSTHRITALGEPTATNYVTCGFYNVPGDLFAQRPDFRIASLRVYLKWLVTKGHPVYGVPLSNVVDIDSPKDVLAAEKFLKHEISGNF